MVVNIPDAPYIVEAERYGMPPYGMDEEIEEAVERLETAYNLLECATDAGYEAASDASKTDLTTDIVSIFNKIEDLQCDIKAIINKLKEV